jgi:hypothetical protein
MGSHRYKIVFILILFKISSPRAQVISGDSIFSRHEPVSIEKIYVHTDREFYALGDTIWYKAYSVDGLSNKPLIEEHNLMVELISGSGLNIQNHKHVLIDGVSS